MHGTPLRRGILALDIQGFGQPTRTDPDRLALRAAINTLLDYDLAAAQIPQPRSPLAAILATGS
jgi:hypothetical protein